MLPLIIVASVIVGAVIVAFLVSKLIDHMDAKGVRESLLLTAAVAIALAYGVIAATTIVAVVR